MVGHIQTHNQEHTEAALPLKQLRIPKNTELLRRDTKMLMEATEPRGATSSVGIEPKVFLAWKLLEKTLPL